MRCKIAGEAFQVRNGAGRRRDAFSMTTISSACTTEHRRWAMMMVVLPLRASRRLSVMRASCSHVVSALFVCIHACMCVFVFMQTRAHAGRHQTYVCMYLCMNTCVRAWMHGCMQVCSCTHTHIMYVHARTHTSWHTV